jgi:signal transduction histidine kinase
MIQQPFQHRSGRVIALGRAVLSSFFALAVWLDPSQSAAISDVTFLLLLSYAAFALIILALTWNRWWIETRLSVPAHVIDLVVFTILVFLTDGYISPFFTFFVFLVLSAAIRWGWREALLTTGLILLLFFAAAFTANRTEAFAEIQIQRFMVRGAHLVVLSLMIVWFGINQTAIRGRGSGSTLLDEVTTSGEPPVRAAMAYAARRLGADRIVFAWSDSEEPWLNVWNLAGDLLTKERLAPGDFPEVVNAAIADRAVLFDSGKKRMLFAEGGGRTSLEGEHPLDPAFAARFDIASGLVIPLVAEGYEGWLLALGVPGLCSDDLAIAEKIGEEMSIAFERSVRFAATQETASAKARLLLARDLHDSVAQVFAGMALKLQSLRRVERPETLQAEVEELQNQLAHEQRDLRKLIAALRDPQQPAADTNLSERLATLVERLEQQWALVCELRLELIEADIPASLQHDIHQLVREAVANAARHGKAKKVEVVIASNDRQLTLKVEDDGEGFPMDGEFDDAALGEAGLGPRSLYERVHALGGTLALTSTRNAGSRLEIVLPTKAHQP